MKFIGRAGQDLIQMTDRLRKKSVEKGKDPSPSDRLRYELRVNVLMKNGAVVLTKDLDMNTERYNPVGVNFTKTLYLSE